MKFENIEVNGITNIVFVKSNTKWTLVNGIWNKGSADVLVDGFKTHEEMMEIVNHLKTDRRYRLGIHWDTLNVRRK